MRRPLTHAAHDLGQKHIVIVAVIPPKLHVIVMDKPLDVECNHRGMRPNQRNVRIEGPPWGEQGKDILPDPRISMTVVVLGVDSIEAVALLVYKGNTDEF
jgi:hypothetical protein